MGNEATGTMVEILLVEDNPGDVRLAQEAFKDAKLRNRIIVAKNGMEALEILSRAGKYANAPRPDVVLLDLNLPGQSGFDVLARMKEKPELADIPVVILSGSKAEQDIARSYQLNASCYITKPLDLQQFMEVIKAIEGFWLTVVKMPATN